MNAQKLNYNSCSERIQVHICDSWVNTCRLWPSAALFFLHSPLWSPGLAHFSPPQLHKGTFWTFKNTQTHTPLVLNVTQKIFPLLFIESDCPVKLYCQSHSAGKQISRCLNWLKLAMKMLVRVGGCWTPSMNRQELPQLVPARQNVRDPFDPSSPRALQLLISNTR